MAVTIKKKHRFLYEYKNVPDFLKVMTREGAYVISND